MWIDCSIETEEIVILDMNSMATRSLLLYMHMLNIYMYNNAMLFCAANIEISVI